MDLRIMLVSQVLSLLQGGLYEFIVLLKLVKRRGEQRGKSNLLPCIKKYVEVLTQRSFPLTPIRATMLHGYTGKEGKTSDRVVHKWSLRRKYAF